VEAIAPLVRGRGRLFGLPVRRLQAMCNEQTPRFDFLVSDEAPGALEALWRTLRRDPSWDVLQLSHLPESGPTAGAIERLAAQAELPVGRWLSEASPFLTFDGGDEAYKQAVGRKHRGNVERLLRRLAELGPVDLEVLSQPDEVDRAFDDALRLEASGWKDRMGTAIASQPRVTAFYRRLAERHAACGALRLLFLTSGGRRIAFVYGLQHRQDFYLLKCGYDPAYARHAPVHVLCHLLFTAPAAASLGTVDFLGGNDEWKQRWTRRTTQHVWLFVFRDAWWTRWLFRMKFELVPRLKEKALYRAVLTKLRGRSIAGRPHTLETSEGAA
jgi:CelD/BcsL family acetyltransferase involved in cellulose biosynthesis